MELFFRALPLVEKIMLNVPKFLREIYIISMRIVKSLDFIPLKIDLLAAEVSDFLG